MSTASQLDYRKVIKDTLMERLYAKQLGFWNAQLTRLSQENAESLGRGNDNAEYAIYYRNKRWAPEALHWTDNPSKVYCLPLNLRVKEYVKRMEEIADEFQQLCEEKYEAERFLSNLVLFAAPPERLKTILGRTLYRVAHTEIEQFCAGFSDRDWELNNEFSLRTFVEQNQSIIKTMNERVMLNLVTL